MQKFWHGRRLGRGLTRLKKKALLVLIWALDVDDI